MKFKTERRTIQNFKSFVYSSVWEIIEMKDGCIFKTKDTGLYIHKDQEHLLPKDKYTLSSISTRILRYPTFKLLVITEVIKNEDSNADSA